MNVDNRVLKFELKSFFQETFGSITIYMSIENHPF